MFSSSTLVTLAAVLATASAQAGTTIQVTVGKGGNIYTPNDIKAEIGTNIEFSFFPMNHTVTESSFKDPCQPLENGFFSTFVPTRDSPSGSTFTITVKDKKPIWLYCGQGRHCQTGMVAAINAPATGNTFEAFTLLAKNATASTSPPGGVVGGILKLAGAANASGSASVSPSGSAAASGLTTVSSISTVQTTVTATITAVVTKDGSTYATTYPSTYGTTYTTGIAQTTVAIAPVGAGTSTSASASASNTGAAAGLAVNGGMAGAVLLAGLAML
ncbi:hypothetical protein VTL71DRAFT_4928 [Oculimacula yallundae]|uniref:Extracellular serine-rich protein n=1 Tax=Oculimacula yallundae TaxID=86028 RepID=A0ABR4C3F0_9HELO